MRVALAANDWAAVGEVMRTAYPLRKRLAPNITTPHMDALIERAMQNGAIAAKVCGAGGGGCIAFFCEEGARGSVEKVFEEDEIAEVLDWNYSPEGLTVKES